MNLGSMDKGSIVSAIGHLGVILWAVMGDWLFAPKDMPPMEVAEVSLMSESEYQAMVASAPKPKDPAAEPAPAKPQVEAPRPIETDLPEAEPLPEPEPVTVPDPVTPPEPLPEELPVSPDPQPVEAPDPVAPIAEEEQPIPVPVTTTKPKPRPIDRVAPTPVDDTTDTPEVADTATPEVSDQAEPEAPVVTEEKPAASPEEAAPVIVTEAVETEEDAPQLAPTSSRRPQSRPEQQAEAPEEPAQTEQTDTAEAEQSDADAEAIAAALAEAAAEEAASADTAADTGLPEGPPMTGGEIEGLRVAINQCWNVGQLSTAAMNTTVTLRVEMGEDGKPTSVEMSGFEGGSESDARQAYEAGRRAVLRCAGAEGYDLPADKYGQWNVLNLIFDPNGMRMR